MEASHSGLVRPPAKRVEGNPLSRVQIPPPPPFVEWAPQGPLNKSQTRGIWEEVAVGHERFPPPPPNVKRAPFGCSLDIYRNAAGFGRSILRGRPARARRLPPPHTSPRTRHHTNISQLTTPWDLGGWVDRSPQTQRRPENVWRRARDSNPG